jgi:hypothetical protein
MKTFLKRYSNYEEEEETDDDQSDDVSSCGDTSKSKSDTSVEDK